MNIGWCEFRVVDFCQFGEKMRYDYYMLCHRNHWRMARNKQNRMKARKKNEEEEEEEERERYDTTDNESEGV